MVRPEFLSLYWLKICENLAKMDLLQTWPKFSGYILAPEVRMYCVPFNNLTVLTGLAVLMESTPAWIAPSVRNCSPFWGPVKFFLSSSFQSLLYVMIQRLFYPYSERILYEVQAPNRRAPFIYETRTRSNRDDFISVIVLFLIDVSNRCISNTRDWDEKLFRLRSEVIPFAGPNWRIQRACVQRATF